jgi:hypothetical protein
MRDGTARRRRCVFGAWCALVLGVAAGRIEPAAAAEVYRCDDNDKVVYSDRPCGKESKTLFGRKDKGAPTAPASAGTRTPSGDAKVQSTADAHATPVLSREASEQLTRCVAESFNRWYLGQDPKPSRETENARLKAFDQGCRKQLDLPAQARTR